MRAAYDRVMAQERPACDACGGPLLLHLCAGERELENELLLVLGGGYGSFVDTGLPERAHYAYVLCESCAVRLCRTFGLRAPMREHHTSTVCECPDRPERDERGFPQACGCADCSPTTALAGPAGRS